MTQLPEHGRAWSELKAELDFAKSSDVSWRRGRMAVYTYFLDDELLRVQQEAYAAYWSENNMAHKVFPSLKKLETDVIAMTLGMLHAPAGAVGTFTSGGSESIFLALKTARDWALAERGITQPNIVLPRTAHPTFDRASHYLGLKVIRVPTTRNDFRADVAGMAKRIDKNTVLVAGSAPNYPYGVFDPIGDIAAMTQERGLWMHVDACVGGFLAPWARDIGYDIPDFDFAVPGVMSMSADAHKYGLAAKGASLMLLRHGEHQSRYQAFEFSNWERGTYTLLTSQGTRAGGAVAAAWAVMNYLGADGYRRVARTIMDTKKRFIAGINGIPGLRVLEPNELCIFSYVSADPALNIDAVAAAMTKRGWLVSRIVEPPEIHLALNPVHEPVVEEYCEDLRAAVAEARLGGSTGAAEATY